MKKLLFAAFLVTLAHCSAGASRPSEVVAAETAERAKPLLNPPSGVFYQSVTVTPSQPATELEYSTGSNFQPLTTATITLTSNTTLTVRRRDDQTLATTEIYTVKNTFTPLDVSPAGGSFNAPVNVIVSGGMANTQIQFSTGGAYQPYSGENGIIIATDTMLAVKQCLGSDCSSALNYSFHIATAGAPPPQYTPRELTTSEVGALVLLAANDYNQTQATGLSALMDNAKLLVVRNSSLMPNAAMRQRFLSQDNTASAAEACTTVARYLYTVARRLTLSGAPLPSLEDFSQYYINHIVAGHITVDSGGQNYIWITNGAALVTPYLPAGALLPFEFDRGTTYPTDFSLLDQLATTGAKTTMLRDGPSASSNTHTFFAVSASGSYTMIDTYFTPFDGVGVRASAGKAWPYGYRFGPSGSRYLHFVYGY